MKLALPASWGIGEDRLESRLAETRFPIAAAHLIGHAGCRVNKAGVEVTGALLEGLAYRSIWGRSGLL